MNRFLRLCGIYFLVTVVTNIVVWIFCVRNLKVEELVMVSAPPDKKEPAVKEEEGFIKIQDMINMINKDSYDSPPPNEEFERDLTAAKKALKTLRSYY